MLAVYAVKATTDPSDPQEVATIDDGKKELLKEIFWAMNEASSRTETNTTLQTVETDDGEGNIIEEKVEVTTTTLYITASHKTVDEMADAYNFTSEQRQLLAELLAYEEAYRRDYSSEADFRKSVAEYIRFYNEQRPHQTLAYKSPVRFEELYGQEETQAL